MDICLCDIDTEEEQWLLDVDTDHFTEGDWVCDCLRGQYFHYGQHTPCCEGGDCLGYDRFIVTKMTETEDDVTPTLHEMNAMYADELLFVNGVQLD